MINHIESLLDEIYSKIRERLDVAVVGMSGGADSTLVAILCAEALGKENVMAVHIPSNAHDKYIVNHRSKLIADKIGIVSSTIDIFRSCFELEESMKESEYAPRLDILTAGNIRSRIRMVCLYSIANWLQAESELRIRVIGTGNLSEDFIGYDTKWGDSACDLFPIGSLFKSEVYQLLEYFSIKGIIVDDMINRTPSAGLWDGQTDELELGYSYDEMEPSIRKIITGKWTQEDWTDIDQFVLDRHMKNRHKHEAVPVLELRQFCD